MDTFSIIIIVIAAIVLVTTIIILSREKYSQDQAHTPNVLNSPKDVQEHEKILKKLEDDVEKSFNDNKDISTALLNLCNAEEKLGLNSFDFDNGEYLGTWKYSTEYSVVPGTTGSREYGVWKYSGITSSLNPNAILDWKTTVSMPLPKEYNSSCIWSLYPNDSAGVPTLRRIADGAKQYNNHYTWDTL